MFPETDVIILGAGVTGLAAGIELKDRAIILERENEPGGLVRSKCFDGGYWFDNVLHLLHFKDAETQERITEMMAQVLKPCYPDAWIETAEGVVKYPFQLNLLGLNEAAKNDCIVDYAKNYYGFKPDEPNNYKEFLLNVFGASMCRLFYFPYNQKLYKYPLEEISQSSILWNLSRPSFENVLKGAFYPDNVQEAYNTNAYYPRPPKDAPLRGMGLLSDSLAKHSCPVMYGQNIVSIDPENRKIVTTQDGKLSEYSYSSACLSTLPLINTIKMCTNAPEDLLKQVDKLQFTNVLSIAITVRGPRPVNTGLWRYYTDEDIPFTRLIFMTAFDAENAPDDGWGVLAEVTLHGKDKTTDYEQLKNRVVTALRTIELLNENCTVIGVHEWLNSPAYVIFTPETESIVKNCTDFLSASNITSLGRYGSWEYSSMYQNIKSGFDWGKKNR